jgi:hypothetical protein
MALIMSSEIMHNKILSMNVKNELSVCPDLEYPVTLQPENELTTRESKGMF